MTSETEKTKQQKNNQTSGDAQTSEVGEHSKRLTERRRFMQGAGVAGAVIATGMAAQAVGRTRNDNQGPALGGPSCESSASTSSSSEIDHTDLAARYQRAQQMNQGSNNRRDIVLNATLFPHWIGDSDQFWYVRETRAGQQYRLVDAAQRTNVLAFDHKTLARRLAKLTASDVDPENLPFKNIEITVSPRTVKFSAFDADWEYNEVTQRCKKLDYSLAPPWVTSPDGKLGAFVRDYNVWVRDIASGQERALTQDGERFYEYASTTTWYGRPERPGLIDLVWSPDSKRILTQLRDTREIKVAPPVIHVPEGEVRAEVIDPQRRRAFANDKHKEAWTLLSIEVQSGAVQWFDCPPQPVTYPHYYGVFPRKQGWWRDNRYVCFVHQELDNLYAGRNTRVLELDSHTGATRVLFKENPEGHFSLIPTSHLECPVLSLPKSDELIWWSDRSGWMHLYLYDARTGQLKNTITQGNWLVRNILHHDADKRELVIQTAGRANGRNPYYRDVCRVNIDTGEITTVISSDHEYVVCDPRDRISHRYKTTGVASSGRYIVATRSRVDAMPVSVLLDRNGREVMPLETADVHGMPKNWRPPEPVLVKAADGQTDIYAVVTRPSNFSPDKSYPVIDFTWVPTVGAFSNDALGNFIYMLPAAYAELGFIVVQVAGRGQSLLRPTLRNKKFQRYSREIDTPYAEMDRADAIAAIKQLAQRYTYMDRDKVGVVDFEVTTGALNGLLVYPDFYKVGIANNPFVDSRMFLFPTTSDEPDYAGVVENLRGKLLLLGRPREEVIPISGLYELVDALQKAGKRFDLMVFPDLRHGPGLPSYGMRIIWDYLVTHLQGVTLPTDSGTGTDS